MGFFFTIFYMTMIYLRPQEFVPALRGLPLMDYLAVICMAAVFLEGSFTAEKFKRSPINFWVLAFWFVTGMSHVANFYFGGALQSWLDVGSRVVFAYYLVVLTVDTFKRLKIFIWIMLLLTLMQALQAILQYYTGAGLVGGEALHRHLGQDQVVLQAQGIGIFADPNDLALTIVTFLPFFLPYIHRPFLSPSLLSGVLLMLPVVTGVVFTRSRGGILGMAFVFWYYFYRRVGVVLSVGFLVAIASVILTLPRMGTISKQDDAVSGRLDHWSYGLELFKANPVFGVGKGMFTENHPFTAHNSFILVLAECGFVGAFVWISLFIAAFREIYLMRRLPRAPPWLNGLLDGLLGSILAWQVCAFFLSQTYKFLSFILLALVVATLNCLSNIGFDLRHPWSAKMTFISLLTTMAAVAGVYVMLRLLWALHF